MGPKSEHVKNHWFYHYFLRCQEGPEHARAANNRAAKGGGRGYGEGKPSLKEIGLEVLEVSRVWCCFKASTRLEARYPPRSLAKGLPRSLEQEGFIIPPVFFLRGTVARAPQELERMWGSSLHFRTACVVSPPGLSKIYLKCI